MLNNINHIKFFENQIQTEVEAWRIYADCPVNTLWKEGRLFIGRVTGYDPLRGNLILRFKKGIMPRMKTFYSLCFFSGDLPKNPADWSFTYTELRTSKKFKIKQTECKTEFVMKNRDENYINIGITKVELDLCNDVKERFLDKNKSCLIILAETDPPIRYLENLRDFVKANPNHALLQLDFDAKESVWQPQNLDNAHDVLPDIKRHFKTNNTLVLQGPPGTGKSYLIAQFCDYLLSMNYSVAVTALTNQALMEVAEKEGLEEWIAKGKVYKTSLSSDEQKKMPKLQSAEELNPSGGELLLASYYKLSDKLVEDELLRTNRFDYLIIEEASQAYLAAIAGFSDLGKSLFVVGDQKQLPPVVKDISEALKISPLILGAIKGFETFAYNHSDLSKRLTRTRRLSQEAANLTGIFYDNQLKSIAEPPLNNYIGQYKNLFHPKGGITVAKLPIVKRGYDEPDIIRLLAAISTDILETTKKVEVALLTPMIRNEKELYVAYSRLSDKHKRITISTIHKIQGLTTDYTVLFLPMSNPSFELNENLFNVATSRAKQGTLIVTNKSIELISNRSSLVGNYLDSIDDVTENFMANLKANG